VVGSLLIGRSRKENYIKAASRGGKKLNIFGKKDGRYCWGGRGFQLLTTRERKKKQNEWTHVRRGRKQSVHFRRQMIARRGGENARKFRGDDRQLGDQTEHRRLQHKHVESPNDTDARPFLGVILRLSKSSRLPLERGQGKQKLLANAVNKAKGL